MTMNTLPPVAKSFFAFCKKCDADRYHVVLAHTSATSAKIKCEICGSQKTYSLPKTQTKTGKPLTGAAAKKREQTMNSRRSSHRNEYEMLMATENAPTASYNMKGKFEKNTKLQHPKFGMGFIKDAMSDKIEVVFEDEVRTLIHNRV
ncbi:hypothetical protein [Bdellovibrio bacteriovorus]|uniref:Uncharacterized protein n=1 Tax=Bdellovibrio bacteriovorus TaxID=959 RepID=A0A150WUJ0_BDEBC|nr:hypothetical protein [Bdellovibrio bacteriovorus]KYG62862.1 hypothetical protein AZI87_16470 [Bdellovibrio bacteriovorus]KYG70066.1 hypothetical protein AZI85_15355 [Bdellovibrio bacteriovorus]